MNRRITKLAASLVRKYGTRDPFKIARELKIKIIFLSLKKQKGFCKIIMNNRFIFINDNMSPQMQRMTCAHEIGHLLLHKEAFLERDILMEMELFDINSQREFEANVFAAELLIDKEQMDDLLHCGYTCVEAASSLDINVNLLLIKLGTKRLDSYASSLPFVPRSSFLGKIEDSAGSIG